MPTRWLECNFFCAQRYLRSHLLLPDTSKSSLHSRQTNFPSCIMHWVQSGIEQDSERGRGKEERRERGREGEREEGREGGREGGKDGENLGKEGGSGRER